MSGFNEGFIELFPAAKQKYKAYMNGDRGRVARVV
jgi:hypothetical protein